MPQQERRVAHEVVQVIEPAIRIVGRPSMQLGLDPQYPGFCLLRRRPRSVCIHKRPPGIQTPPLRTCCLPSPCGRLSRPRTSTEAPPRLRVFSRRRTCPLAGRDGRPGGRPETVPTFTHAAGRRGRRPAVPRQPCHGYAAGLHHGLRTGDLRPVSGVAHHDMLGGRTLLTDPSARFGVGTPLTGLCHWFLALHLLVSIAGPATAGSTNLSRRCRGCSRPSLRLQGQAAPIFTSLLRQAHGGVLSPPHGRRRLVAHEVICVSDQDRAARFDAIIRAVSGSGDRFHPVQGDVQKQGADHPP